MIDMIGMIDRLARSSSFATPPESKGEARGVRMFEAVVVLLIAYFVWTWASQISGPPTIVHPLGLARELDLSVFRRPIIAWANAAAISGLLVVGFLRKWSWAYLAVVLLGHLQYVARYSLGKAGHGSHLAGLALLAFGLAHVLYRDPVVRRWAAMGFVWFLYGLGYTSAGVCKLVATGFDWVDGRHLWLWIEEKSVDALSSMGAAKVNALQQLVLDHVELGTLLLTGGLMAELFGWALWLRRARPFILVALLGMHVGIWLAMNIAFWSNALLLVALLNVSVHGFAKRQLGSSLPE